MKINIVVLIIVILAAILRLPFLDQIPNGFSGDEAQQGYSAYSILKTDRDEWGQFLPLAPRGFGDYKPPLYTYLSVPFVALFGLNVYSVRLLAAVSGILSVLVVYFLALELFGDKRVALWSSFLLSISPWHIQLSRTAFEGGVGVLFFSLGLLFFFKGLKKDKYLLFSSIFLGLTLYSYHSFRLFIPLILGGLFILYRSKITLRKSLNFLIILLIMLMPLLYNFQTTLIRASDVGIMSTENINGYFKNKGTTSLPTTVDRFFDNKIYFLLANIYSNYLSYYSPLFLFGKDRPNNSYLNFNGYPLLFPLEIIFWLFAGYALIFKKVGNAGLVTLWLLTAAIPASLASGSLSANRAVVFLPLTAMISGLGVKELIVWFNNKFSSGIRFLTTFWSVLLILSLFSFLYFYLIKLPQNPPESLRVGYDKIFYKILSQKDNYKQIIISKSFTQPQIFLAFYGVIDPVLYQQASHDWLRYEKSGKKYIDQLESWNLGNFLFEDLNWQVKDGKRLNALIVGKTDDFPAGAAALYDFEDSKGQVIYKLVPTNKPF